MTAIYEGGNPKCLVAIISTSGFFYQKLGIEKYRLSLEELLKPNEYELLRSNASESEYLNLSDVIGKVISNPILKNLLAKKLTAAEAELVSTGMLYSTAIEQQKNTDLLETKKNATRYELAIKGMNDGIWDWNILTNEVYYSLQWKKMLGFEDHELENILHTWQRLMHPDDAEKTTEAVQEYLAKKTPNLYHLTRFLHKDGSYRLIVCRGYMELDKDGTPVRMVGSHTDVTQISNMEYKLQQQKEFFELAVTASNEGIWDWNLGNDKIYFSPRWKSMFGYDDNELSNTQETWKSLIFQDDYTTAMKLVEELRNGKRNSFETIQKFKHKDGHVVVVKSKAIKVCDKNGMTIRLVGSHSDITDFINSQNQLLVSEEKYRSIIENMDLGMLHVDNEDVIVDVSNKFSELTGYRKCELLGKKASKLLVSHEDVLSTHELIKDRLKKQSSVYERLLRCQDGTQKWVLISGTPEIDKDGKVIGSIGIHLDITERKQTELALVDAKMLAEENSKSREKLLAKVSHEMRTPMQAFMGFVNYLDSKELSSEVKTFSSDIKLAIESLNSLVNDLLDMNTIHQGRLKLVPRAVKMHTAFDNLVNYYRRLIPKNKNIVLSYFISPEFPKIIAIDPFRVQQIAGNLLSNAIKYTDHGSINCKVDWKYTSSKSGYIVFKISDTGVGIPKEQHDNIFNEFYQLGASGNTASHDGVGLGLSIVKQLIDAFNGKIHLESQVNQGATFTVIIPAEIMEDNIGHESHENTTTTSPNIAEIRVLIAEDNTIIRRLIATYLIDKNFYIDAALNGQEAVEYFSKYDYDFVLLDINMPVMNGYDTAKAIRTAINKADHLTNTKIVAFSASVLPSGEERKRLHNFDDFIQKPVDLPWLVKYLQDNFSENNKSQQNHLQDPVLEDKPEDFLNDPELSEELKMNIAKMLIKELEKEAPKISELTLQQQIDKLLYSLHSFKSSAGILRLSNTLNLIESIENDLEENTTITDKTLANIAQLNENILSTRNFLIEKLAYVE
jgi:two-component system, sensor histidine kinase